MKIRPLIASLFVLSLSTTSHAAEPLSDSVIERWASMMPSFNTFIETHQTQLDTVLNEGRIDPREFFSVSDALDWVGLLPEMRQMARQYGFSGPEQVYATKPQLDQAIKAWKHWQSRDGEINDETPQQIVLVDRFAEKLALVEPSSEEEKPRMAVASARAEEPAPTLTKPIKAADIARTLPPVVNNAARIEAQPVSTQAATKDPTPMQLSLDAMPFLPKMYNDQ